MDVEDIITMLEYAVRAIVGLIFIMCFLYIFLLGKKSKKTEEKKSNYTDNNKDENNDPINFL